jgi:tRNA threonylcarbamoyladenosine biosynthesis protein TsaB
MATRRHPLPSPGPLVLGIETATGACGLAVLAGDRILAEFAFVTPRGQSALLMQGIDAIVRITGTPADNWQAVAVSRGPGSFTGLRIGMATAKALGFSLGIPLYGIPTLSAMASRLAPFHQGPACVLLDARKGQVFAALFQIDPTGACLLEGPAAMAPGEVPGLAPPEALFAGDAAPLHGAAIAAAYGHAVRWAPEELGRPSAAAVARLALPLIRENAPSQLAGLVPDYVRASDAEIHHSRLPGKSCPV